MFRGRPALLAADRVFEQWICIDWKSETIGAFIGTRTGTHVADFLRVGARISVWFLSPTEIHTLLDRTQHARDILGAGKQRDVTHAPSDLLGSPIHEPLRRVSARRRIER